VREEEGAIVYEGLFSEPVFRYRSIKYYLRYSTDVPSLVCQSSCNYNLEVCPSLFRSTIRYRALPASVSTTALFASLMSLTSTHGRIP